MANKRPWQQKAQMDQTEQGGIPTAQINRAYADPTDDYSGHLGFQSPGFDEPLPAGERVAQHAQVRTDEQAGTPSAAAQKAYSNL